MPESNPNCEICKKELSRVRVCQQCGIYVCLACAEEYNNGVELVLYCTNCWNVRPVVEEVIPPEVEKPPNVGKLEGGCMKWVNECEDEFFIQLENMSSGEPLVFFYINTVARLQ